jgi:bifunctional polynucleotide phosphatase/kinase
MWHHMVERLHVKYGPDVTIDIERSFFVGDAAGRPGDRGGDCDLKLGSNIGIRFFTPEKFWPAKGWEGMRDLVSSSTPIKSESSTSSSSSSSNSNTNTMQSNTSSSNGVHFLFSKGVELVLFHGCPASGKTTFYKRHFEPKGYVHVNQDQLKTWQKCVEEVDRLLERRQSCVVDNTNPDKEKRSKFIALACARGVPVRCVEFLTSRAEANFLNEYRSKSKRGYRELLPKIAFDYYYRLLEAPTEEEGFLELIRVAPLRDEKTAFEDASAETRFQSLHGVNEIR